MATLEKRIAELEGTAPASRDDEAEKAYWAEQAGAPPGEAQGLTLIGLQTLAQLRRKHGDT